jgi:ABC-type Zn uptake system ZnuABC Zn-binding protein ZnuA
LSPGANVEHLAREAEFVARLQPISRRYISLSATLTLTVVAAVSAAQIALGEPLRIVATTTDLASLAQSVVANDAQVESIVPPAADPESFEPRPSDLGKLKGASIVIRVGLGYDHWLDKLIANLGDAAIARGAPGYVDASRGIPLLEVKGRTLDPAARDGHAHGLANPHYWLDPKNAELITAALTEAIASVAPQDAANAIARRERFLADLDSRLAAWERELAPHRAVRLVAYHNTWPYFARRFRLDIVDVIETKEGLAPSPARLAKLASIMREQKVRVILHEPFEPDEASQLLARRSGAVIVKLAPSVGALPQATDYMSLFASNVRTLANALSGTW